MTRILVWALIAYLAVGVLFGVAGVGSLGPIGWQCPDPSGPGWVYGTDATPHGPGCRPEETFADRAGQFGIVTVLWLPLFVAKAVNG